MPPSYFGRYADYYDTFYASKDYAGESAFVHRVLTGVGCKARGRLLELACGTGSHAFELERLGWEIVATDQSDDMLRVARAKAERVETRVQFRRADMRAIPPSFGQFDAAIALFDSIGHVLHNDAIAAVLSGVRTLLKPGGSFLFEFLHSAAMLTSFEPIRVRRWQTPEGDLIRIGETSLDAGKGLATIQYDVIDLRQDGSFERLLETQVNRFFSVAEIQALLTESEFIPRCFFAGFTDRQLIDETVWRIVAVAQRS
jgi:SAM-dependent methyltransferase